MDPKLRVLASDRRRLAKVVGRMISIALFLDPTKKMVSCPFHPDRTPSAKLFSDGDCDRLFCFAEGRHYTGYDYILKILEVDPLSFLREKFSDQAIITTMELVESSPEKKPMDVTAAVRLFRETGSVEGMLKLLYATKG